MNLSRHLAAVAAAVTTAAAFTSPAQAQPAQKAGPVVKLCTGAKGGNYEFSGQRIAELASGLNVQVINTTGSWDNMQKMKAGECDAATVQEDAVVAFKRQNNFDMIPLSNMYQEALHLICNKASGVTQLKDLMDSTKKVALGKPGSGPWVTWQNIVAAEKRYAKVVPSEESGVIAASQVDQGELDCFLAISGVRSASLNKLDADYGKKTTLVKVRDGDLSTPKGMTGKQLYTKTEIAEGTYPNWTPKAVMSDNSVDTVSVMAKVVARKDLDESVVAELINSINRAMPAIQKRVQPQ